MSEQGHLQLEHRQLDLRFADLRVRRPGKERRLLSSLSEHGQQVPIVVVPSGVAGTYVVVDGHKRVRALKRLGSDTVNATVWEMGEAEALLLARSLRTAEAESALEQGWLIHALHASFGRSQEEIARQLDRSPSWVSRRLALVRELPESVQELVRRGRVSSHAAMKHLVPMARANRADCERLAAAVADLGLSTRDIGATSVPRVTFTTMSNEAPLAARRLRLTSVDFVKRGTHAASGRSCALRPVLGARRATGSGRPQRPAEGVGAGAQGEEELLVRHRRPDPPRQCAQGLAPPACRRHPPLRALPALLERPADVLGPGPAGQRRLRTEWRNGVTGTVASPTWQRRGGSLQLPATGVSAYNAGIACLALFSDSSSLRSPPVV